MAGSRLGPDVEGFLALLATRRAPKTVEAYRRDLAALSAWFNRPIEKISRLGSGDGSAIGETAAEFVGLDFGL